MSEKQQDQSPGGGDAAPESAAESGETPSPKPREVGGPKGPEPTRYGDWERKGIASDF